MPFQELQREIILKELPQGPYLLCNSKIVSISTLARNYLARSDAEIELNGINQKCVSWITKEITL